MALTYTLALGSSQTGLAASLRAAIMSQAGTIHATERDIASGFVEVAAGNYSFAYTPPASYTGSAVFYTGTLGAATDFTGVTVKAIADAAPDAHLTAQQVRDAMKLAPSVGAPADGSIDSELDALSELLNSAPTITVSSPVARDGKIALIRGDDYLNADNRRLALLNVTTGLDLASATNEWIILEDSASESASALMTLTVYATVILGGYALKADMTAAQSAQLVPGALHRYTIRSTLSSGHVITWQQGTVTGS